MTRHTANDRVSRFAGPAACLVVFVMFVSFCIPFLVKIP